MAGQQQHGAKHDMGSKQQVNPKEIRDPKENPNVGAATEQRQARQSGEQAQDTERTEVSDTPKSGETYRCERCGMELKVTADCNCDDPQMVHMECCGQELARA